MYIESSQDEILLSTTQPRNHANRSPFLGYFVSNGRFLAF